MNSFIDIVIMRKTKDPEGFATTAYDVVASVRAYREGRHPWKAEVTEGDKTVKADTIANWYKEVYEPSYTAAVTE